MGIYLLNLWFLAGLPRFGPCYPPESNMVCRKSHHYPQFILLTYRCLSHVSGLFARPARCGAACQPPLTYRRKLVCYLWWCVCPQLYLDPAKVQKGLGMFRGFRGFGEVLPFGGPVQYIFYYILLYSIIFYYILLYSIIFYYILLYSIIFLLYSIIFYCSTCADLCKQHFGNDIIGASQGKIWWPDDPTGIQLKARGKGPTCQVEPRAVAEWPRARAKNVALVASTV